MIEKGRKEENSKEITLIELIITNKMKLKNMNKNRQSTGVTLIALVITIIVLLILAGVSIATLSGNNGILTHANDAKIETALGAVKEAIRLEQVEKKVDGKNVNSETLLAEGKVSRTVQQGNDENYYMYYAIKDGAYNGMSGLGKGNIASLKDVFLIDDNLNIKYIASNGKEYGDNLNNKILEDETEIRFSSKAFSEYVSKISGVTEENMKFKWMKNQTNLTIEDSSVDSLQDLIFFPNLTSLRLMNLTLENLEGIENCNKLKNFYAESTSIRDYMSLSDLQELDAFEVLFAKDLNFDNVIDSLKTIDNLSSFILNVTEISNSSMIRISELSNNLTKVYFRATNKIEKIEGLENKTNLIELNLQGNKISKIEGLQNCKKLQILNIAVNQITKIEGLDELTELKNLNLSYNKISNILELEKNTNLLNLDIIQNPDIKADRNEYTEEENKKLDKIQEIMTIRNGDIFINPNQLKLFKGYKKLILSGGYTTLESLEGQTEIEELSIFNQNITLSDEKSQNILKSMTKLKKLELNYNPIETLKPINELKNLELLFVSEIKNDLDLSEIEDIISQVKILGLKQGDIDSLVKCNPKKITKLDFDKGTYTTLPKLNKFINLENLIIIGNLKIEKNDFSYISELINLKYLTLNDMNLSGKMIDFSKLTNLKELNLTFNYLNTSDIANLSTLKNNTDLKIDLRNNSIIDASALLELDKSCTIYLRSNINLTQESKDKLKERFGNKVTF